LCQCCCGSLSSIVISQEFFNHVILFIGGHVADVIASDQIDVWPGTSPGDHCLLISARLRNSVLSGGLQTSVKLQDNCDGVHVTRECNELAKLVSVRIDISLPLEVLVRFRGHEHSCHLCLLGQLFLNHLELFNVRSRGFGRVSSFSKGDQGVVGAIKGLLLHQPLDHLYYCPTLTSVLRKRVLL
jgi:hypothetical protein